MTPFTIAGLQLHLTPGHDNLPLIKARLDTLMHVYPHVQMVVLSELAVFGPGHGRAETMPGPTEDVLCALAAHHGIWFIPGSLLERVGDQVFNTTPIIDPRGKVVDRHRKLFPFLPYEYDIAAGDRFVTFDVPDIGRFGVAICYDLWFPEVARTLAVMGAEVIIHPVYTATMDRDLELVMARATAVQQQLYVVSINGSGGGGYGQSIFVGPEGEVLHQAGTTVELMPVELDLDRVRRTREVGVRGLGQPLKSFRDRQLTFDIYRDSPDPRGFLASLGPLRKPARADRAGILPKTHTRGEETQR